MPLRRISMALCAVCLSLPIAAFATDRIPVESFAKRPEISLPRLSPDGAHLAVRVDSGDGQHALMVYKIADMSRPVSMLRMPRFELPVNIAWVSPTRLIVEKGRELGSLDAPVSYGEILATDLDGKHQDYLFGYNGQQSSRGQSRGGDRGFGWYDGQPQPMNGHFFMGARMWGVVDQSTLYDVDASRNTRHLMAQIGIEDMNFMVGGDGRVRYAYGRNADYDYVVFHRQGSTWSRLESQQVGGTFVPLDTGPTGLRVFARFNPGDGPAWLVTQDELGGSRQLLARDGFGSVGWIEWTAPPSQPFATALATGVLAPVYIDANSPTAKLHRALSLKFPGSYVHFIDYSEDGGQLLFSTVSDRSPGSYFLIDTHTFKVNKLFDAAPWIDPATMAERRPLHFTASDGKELEAILTLPKGAGEKQLPMVLLPHGGPIGVSDDWTFDGLAQFLASRGYLVLQVNYRGSGGRGAAFEQAGYLQWGTRIQQDLIDGVKWAIARQYADPKRACVFGGSFGGYSAMMSVVRAPGLFKCAIGYAGVYDLAMMYDKGDIRENKSGRSYLRKVIGRDDAELAANSPDHLADRIDVPVFLIHGEDDQRVPFAQAKAMRAALDAAHKPYEWMSKPGEGHGFYSERNNVELYTRVQAFLEKYIGKGA